MIRILVVEDDRDISALIQLALKNAGYDVFAAFDGQEGANLLETQKFELCLLDIMLPQISGYELFSYINEYSIPVIVILFAPKLTFQSWSRRILNAPAAKSRPLASNT